jgi:hypothetical protein
MTLAVAFIRKLPAREERRELVIASDSRLSWGQRLDHGPKIFELPRSDALFAFAGDTAYAYPLATHLSASIQMYPRSVDRRFPITKARGHMLRVFDQVYRSIHGLPVGRSVPIEDDPPVQFLFAGFWWQQNRFRIWYIDLDRGGKVFRFRRGGNFFFIGDREAVGEARARTCRLINERCRTLDTIDMEPFEVLRDIILEKNHPYVGGAPQIAKVYQHLNTQFFATLWPSEAGATPHVFGRPLLPIEQSAWPVFDPMTLSFVVEDKKDSEALT